LSQKRIDLKKRLPELLQMEALFSRHSGSLEIRTETTIPLQGHQLPIYSASVGSYIKGLPTFLMTAGIHGVERIGTEVVLAFMETLLSKLSWEPNLKSLLTSVNLVFMPLINPGGMLLNTRANPNGVDLMRNAAIKAETNPPLFFGGQRLSKHIPWYRGKSGAPMETENQALETVVGRLTQDSPFTLSIDCHSGFGFRDRLWFPYAYRKRPIAVIDKLLALKLLLDKTYPNHHYAFEPQSKSYITHGDLWDHLYKRNKNNKSNTPGLFIPLTLEMGSWIWVKKRPLQIFAAGGLFNPIAPHRRARVLRRHLLLFDFLCSATAAHKVWLPSPEERSRLSMAAKSLWYSA
jgi:hypothetical protein